MVERDDGLYVEGALDIEHSQLAREAWRLVKAGVVGLSFGFVPTRVKNRDGGGRHLHAVDEFEISLTPAPMNPDARILSMKRLTALDKRVDEQTARAHRHVQQLLDNDQDERAAQLLCEFDTGGAW